MPKGRKVDDSINTFLLLPLAISIKNLGGGSSFPFPYFPPSSSAFLLSLLLSFSSFIFYCPYLGARLWFTPSEITPKDWIGVAHMQGKHLNPCTIPLPTLIGGSFSYFQWHISWARTPAPVPMVIYNRATIFLGSIGHFWPPQAVKHSIWLIHMPISHCHALIQMREKQGKFANVKTQIILVWNKPGILCNSREHSVLTWEAYANSFFKCLYPYHELHGRRLLPQFLLHLRMYDH